MKTYEHDEQVALFERIALMVRRNYPELALLFAIPNGEYRPKRVAFRLKEEGVKPGVPDLCLPVSRGGFHGLWIEMKVKTNVLSIEQKGWLEGLTNEGYFARVCYGQDEAFDTIISYLEMKKG